LKNRTSLLDFCYWWIRGFISSEKKLTPEVKGWQRDMADHFYNENQAKEEW